MGVQITGLNAIVANNAVLNMSYNGIVFSGCQNAKITQNYVNGYVRGGGDRRRGEEEARGANK